jgi:hypothetical protein
LLAHALPAIAGGVVAVLHYIGSDRHKTIAGKVADGLTEAGAVAQHVHDMFLNGVQHGDPSKDPPT